VGRMAAIPGIIVPSRPSSLREPFGNNYGLCSLLYRKIWFLHSQRVHTSSIKEMRKQEVFVLAAAGYSVAIITNLILSYHTRVSTNPVK
jgi:hypothetical protein